MASPGTFHSGKYATAALGGPGSGSGTTLITMADWACNVVTAVAEFINNNSGGRVLRESTILDANGTLSGDFDFNNNPFLTVGIVPGVLLSDLCLYLNQTAQGEFDGIYFKFPSVVIMSTPVRVGVSRNGKPLWQTTWANAGAAAWVLPGVVNL